jgi:AraC-like DNA-binding protein
MSKENIIRLTSLTDIFDGLKCDKPKHPLIGVVDVDKLNPSNLEAYIDVKMTTDYYIIILKDGDCGMQYGRNKYDFEEGVLRFIAPNQVISSTSFTQSNYGFMLFFHPDLLRHFDLGNKMNKYNFFNYEVHEALHLSKKEEDIMMDAVKNIKAELNENIDANSQELLVTNIQLLLNYSKRFYERQFITRANGNSDVVSKIENLIQSYYSDRLQLKEGTPTPEYFAQKVNFSNNYLSDVLKKETGKSTKDHIDNFVIELAKTQLVNTKATINEIAYDLGFNYPHYFSRLFKKKTGETPNNYRSQFLN